MKHHRGHFHSSWLRAPELAATELAIGSVNRVLASLDRMEAHDAHIADTLAEYRAIDNACAQTRAGGR